jgi:acyl carrier protein
MTDIEQKVRAYIIETVLFGNEEEAPDSEASFFELNLIDSTGVLELVTFLESTFAIQVADDELIPENLDSIRKIASYIERKTGNG